MVDYFRRHKEDPVYCHSLTMRSMVSLMDYRPTRSFSEVTIPVMGLIGEREGMMPIDMSKSWWLKADIPQGRMRVVKGAHHLLFHDNIKECVPIVSEWFHKTLG
jgi:pimeloyl-ACP methyl ester carboxylesterase